MIAASLEGRPEFARERQPGSAETHRKIALRTARRHLAKLKGKRDRPLSKGKRLRQP